MITRKIHGIEVPNWFEWNRYNNTGSVSYSVPDRKIAPDEFCYKYIKGTPIEISSDAIFVSDLMKRIDAIKEINKNKFGYDEMVLEGEYDGYYGPRIFLKFHKKVKNPHYKKELKSYNSYLEKQKLAEELTEKIRPLAIAEKEKVAMRAKKRQYLKLKKEFEKEN